MVPVCSEFDFESGQRVCRCMGPLDQEVCQGRCQGGCQGVGQGCQETCQRVSGNASGAGQLQGCYCILKATGMQKQFRTVRRQVWVAGHGSGAQ